MSRGAPQPDNADPRAIDWARVTELRDEIGPEEFAEVVALFLAEADAMVDRLAGLPPDAHEEALHALKGAALNLGLGGLARLCHAGELAAAEGRADETGIARVLTAYAAARAALLDGLARGAI